MKSKADQTESKELNKLFKDSFKKKLVQQIEAKIITYQEARAKYGIGNSVLADWKKKFGQKAILKKKSRIDRIVTSTKSHQDNIKFWKEFKSIKTEAEIYKTLIELAKSQYKIDLKKNYGLRL